MSGIPYKQQKIARTAPAVKKTTNESPKAASASAASSSSSSSAVEAARAADLEELRLFDLDLKFGPCVGVPRLARWERAAKNELSPPEHIKALLERHAEDEAYTLPLWSNFQSL